MNLQVFESEEFGRIRTVSENGEPLFVANDVCEALGVDRTQTRRLDNDEKGVRSIHTPGGNQNLLIVNEYGLYNLVLASRKPQAKAFKRWITHEVIPSIRKTGKYGVQQQTLSEESYKPSVKYYRGIPVVTKKDLAAVLNTFPARIQRYMNYDGMLVRSRDYYVLSGLDLEIFNKDNPGVVLSSTAALTVITESGVRKICRDRKRSTVCKDIFGVARSAVTSLPKAVSDADVEVPKRLVELVKAVRKQVIALDCITKMLLNIEKCPQKSIDGYQAVIFDCYAEMALEVSAIRKFK